jgi:hypothetical protein
VTAQPVLTSIRAVRPSTNFPLTARGGRPVATYTFATLGLVSVMAAYLLSDLGDQTRRSAARSLPVAAPPLKNI